MPTKTDPALVASELRVVLGRLVRRLRAEHRFPLSHGMALGRLDRDPPRLLCQRTLAPVSLFEVWPTGSSSAGPIRTTAAGRSSS